MKKKFLWIGVIGTVVVGLIALGYAVTGETRTAAAELKALQKEARGLGIPTTMDEVPLGAGSEGDNAALLIQQASDRIGTDKQAVADLLVEAARKPVCVFEWAKVQEPGFWKRLKLLDCIGALLEDAAAQLSAGSDAGFQRKLHAAFVVSRLIANSPTEEAFRASVEAERKTYEWMAAKMVEFPENAMLHSFAQKETFEKRPLNTLQIALRKFDALGNEIAQNKEIDGDQRITWLWARNEFPSDPWGRDAAEATHLKGAIELTKRVSGASGWPDAMTSLESTVDDWIKDERPLAYTLRTTAASIRDIARLAAENEAARRILFVAAGAFKSRIQKKAFPATSPVMGEMELDPFTGKPMTFSNLGTGFFIYSVGSDMFDSSGPVEDGLTFNEDIGFRLKAWKSAVSAPPVKKR